LADVEFFAHICYFKSLSNIISFYRFLKKTPLLKRRLFYVYNSLFSLDFDAGAHGRADIDAADESSLGGRWFGFFDDFQDGLEVFDQFGVVE